MKSRLLVCVSLLLLQATVFVLPSGNGSVLVPPSCALTWERFRCNVDCEIDPDGCKSEVMFKDTSDILENQGILIAGYNLMILVNCWMAYEQFLNESLPVSQRFSKLISALELCSIRLMKVSDNMIPKSTSGENSQFNERYLPNIPAKPCDPNVCKLPQCFCGGTQPGELRVEEIPQMVLITFDDAVDEQNYHLYQQLFNGTRKNPNGCSIKATFYVSHEWTNYGNVQNLYSQGHEIASHSISHGYGGENFSKTDWEEEIQGQKKFLSTYAGINSEDIRGMRAPFLQIGGDNQFSMLYENNFTYDSSMFIYQSQTPMWPYTLDASIPHECEIPPCPTLSFPGIWEIPMTSWENTNGRECPMFNGIQSSDGICSNPLPTVQDVYTILVNNFKRFYLTNRAPFGLFFHSDWFDYPHHSEGFEAFMNTLSAMDDVYLVTSSQMIDWMRTPTALNKIKEFRAWQCDHQQAAPCEKPNVCYYQFQENMRNFTTCKPCPPNYPWIITANS